MSRPVALAIAVVAVLQTFFAISSRFDVARCEAAGHSAAVCLKMVGG